MTISEDIQTKKGAMSVKSIVQSMKKSNNLSLDKKEVSLEGQQGNSDKESSIYSAKKSSLLDKSKPSNSLKIYNLYSIMKEFGEDEKEKFILLSDHEKKIEELIDNINYWVNETTNLQQQLKAEQEKNEKLLDEIEQKCIEKCYNMKVDIRFIKSLIQNARDKNDRRTIQHI